MTSAAAILVVNILVALLFSISFTLIAKSYGSQVPAGGFAVSYLVGALAPGSELLILQFGHIPIFSIVSYGGLLAGLLLMGVSLVRFYGGEPNWRVFGGLFIAGLVLRLVIWDGQRDWLPYEIAFQAPFAFAALLSGCIVLRMYREKPLSWWLAIALLGTGIHFLVKPLAAAWLGSGSTAQGYAYSRYALFSQASSGVLLTATGLMAILVVFQKAVTETGRQAETDPLTDLLNRRGFNRRAKLAFQRSNESGRPISAIMLDLDHFKSVNDKYGHDFGDTVLMEFASAIKRLAPAGAIAGRMGGEEFLLILENVGVDGAVRTAEAIRLALQNLIVGNVSGFTVSGGAAQRQSGEGLKDLLRAADMASYHAKTTGRNRISHFRALPGLNLSLHSEADMLGSFGGFEKPAGPDQLRY